MAPTLISDLFLLDELEDAGRTREIAEGDLHALHAVADWIKAFVARPHGDLGRAGSVCPFVPGALERKTLWLAPERIAGRGVAWHVARQRSDGGEARIGERQP